MPNFSVLPVNALIEANAEILLDIAFHDKSRIQDYMRQLEFTEAPPIHVARDLRIIEGRHRVLAYYFAKRRTILGERL